jgi:ribosomal-protein-alanine N-acetyltransferase
MARKIKLLPITIEPMTLKDLDEVLVIERMVFPTPWTKGAFVSELREDSHSFFIVAKFKGRVIGYAGFWQVYEEAHITNLALHPGFRGMKVAHRLLVQLMASARSSGLRRATLEVRSSNTKAQRFYHRHGFKDIAIQKGYYSDTKEDAIIMLKEGLSVGNEI